MPKRDRNRIQEEVKQRIRSVANGSKLIPMPHKAGTVSRRIAIAEWEEFHERRRLYKQVHSTYEEEFGRPSAPTIKKISTMLAPYLKPIHEELDRLPVTTGWMTEDEKRQCAQAARVAFIIVLDTFVSAGLARGTVTFNNVFDALGRKFSDHYRFSIANSARDMTKEAVQNCRRDLLLSGIEVNDLWDLVVQHWHKAGTNPLFDVNKPNHTGYGQLRLQISRKESSLLDSFQDLLASDRQYTYAHSPGVEVRFASQEFHERGRKCKVCACRAYQEVELRERSREALRLQSRAILLLDVDAFNKDYDMVSHRRDNLSWQLNTEYQVNPALSDARRTRWRKGRKTQIWSQRDEYIFYRAIEKGLSQIGHQRQAIEDVQTSISVAPRTWAFHLEGFLRWRNEHGSEESRHGPSPSIEELAKAARVTEEWRQEVRQLLVEYDRLQRYVHEYECVHERVKAMSGLHPIRCGFLRIINRRYQPLHFWPTYVSARELGREDEEEQSYSAAEEEQTSFRKRWFRARCLNSDKPCALVGQDVSSSQTQILAVLLGIEKLENLIMGPSAYLHKSA